MRISGALCVKNYEDFGSFETIRELCDHVVVIDDGSVSDFPYKKECDDYVRLERSGNWNDFGNWMLAFSRAYIANCPWVLRMDHDLIMTGLNRESIERHILDLENSQKTQYCCKLMEVYDEIDKYRTDSYWGTKRFSFLFRNYFFSKYIHMPENPEEKRLHRDITPAVCSSKFKTLFSNQVLAYHFGSFNLKRREERYRKYVEENDPERIYQSNYEYLIDEKNISLNKIPDDHVKILKSKAKVIIGE